MATISKAERRERSRLDKARSEVAEQRRRTAEQRAVWEAQVEALVAGGGVAIMTVRDRSEDALAPWLSYTVGHTAHGRPELCVWGENPEGLTAILDALSTQVKSRGSVADGDVFAVPMTDEDGEVLRRARPSMWSLTRVPPSKLPLLDLACSRYTFVRAMRVTQLLEQAL